MSTKTLRWLGFVLPVLFVAGIMVLRVYMTPWIPVIYQAAIELLLVAVAGALFSNWVANRFDRHEREMEARAAQLEALRQAALGLTQEVELSNVLQKVVDVSRELGAARYAALGVLDPDSATLKAFLTSGMTNEERAGMGEPPRGLGLLGVMLTERRAIRIDRISADPRAAGFPPGHPPMTTMLGVPIVSRGQIYGNIYLTDKVGASPESPLPFTSEDQRTLEMFAAQAAIAIENARLNEQNQQIAIMQERERFGMNLHDGVIQSIYALGLLLEDAQHHALDHPELTRDRISQCLRGLDDVIRDIRSYIMDLRPPRFAGRSLQQGLEEIAAFVSANSPVKVRLNLDTAVAGAATAQQTDELLHVTQEALTNIQRHAQAEEVEIRLTRIGSRLFLTIEDNGLGFDVFRAADRASGNGLRNMQERARALNGEFEIESHNGKGTRIVLSVPLSSRTRAPVD